MHILERIDSYIEEIKQKPYIYKIQKIGIEILKQYIEVNSLNIEEEEFNKSLLDHLILLWLPRHKKYLSEAEIYQIIYTIHDIYNYIYDKSVLNNKSSNEATILELYGEEYMRIYKAKNLLQKMTYDPIISMNPVVVDLQKYKCRKKNSSQNKVAVTYEQAFFEVRECKEGGQVILNKLSQTKDYPLLLEYPAYKYLRKGDIIHAIIRRKLFYVYWEIEEIRAYYLPQAMSFLKI